MNASTFLYHWSHMGQDGTLCNLNLIPVFFVYFLRNSFLSQLIMLIDQWSQFKCGYGRCFFMYAILKSTEKCRLYKLTSLICAKNKLLFYVNNSLSLILHPLFYKILVLNFVLFIITSIFSRCGAENNVLIFPKIKYFRWNSSLNMKFCETKLILRFHYQHLIINKTRA